MIVKGGSEATGQGDSVEARLSRTEFFTLVIASCAVIAASWQAWIARDTGLRQLRAYVLIKSESVKLKQANEQSIAVEATDRNFGQTPSLFIIVKGGFDVEGVSADRDYGGEISEDKMATMVEERTGIPGEDFNGNISSAAGPPESDLRQIGQGKSVIVIRGVISYMDVFRQQRKSEFCYFFDTATPDSLAKLCKNHNLFE